MTIARFSRIVLVSATLVVVVAGAGCYNPKIKDGGLKCNPIFIDDDSCPEGYYCDGVYCRKGARTDAAVERAPDVKAEASVDKMPEVAVEAPVDTGPCLSPVSGCTPDMAGKKCDPLCQTGCGCHEKCSANMGGTLTCNVPSGPLVKKQGQSCDIVNEGMAAQTDNCEPGLVCLHEACGDLCARFCRVDADCPGSACSRATAGGLKVCDVPFMDCNPVRNGGPCPTTAQACYLSSSVIDRTTCDCPFAASAENASCTLSRDCFPGLACVDATGGGDFRCRRVCSLAGGANNPCPVANCRAVLNSKKFGYCN